MAVEVTNPKLGKDEGEDKFRGKMRLIALLQSIGDKGREALTSVGFELNDGASTYEEVMVQLKNIYQFMTRVVYRSSSGSGW